jgi:hypothetical protein
MTTLDPMSMQGMGGSDASPTNQQPYDPNNPNMSMAPWNGSNQATPGVPAGAMGTPGTGTTPSGAPPDSSQFTYNPNAHPATNLLNYLGSQMSSLKDNSTGGGDAAPGSITSEKPGLNEATSGNARSVGSSMASSAGKMM